MPRRDAYGRDARGPVSGRRRAVRVGLASALMAAAACTTGPQGSPTNVHPVGPPRVSRDAVRRHAEQFDTDLADRVAGTQQEQAASTYLLGHLQRAGYVVRLDPVPLGDLVRSTNVVALPPSGKPPDVVVAVAYDAPATQTIATGEVIGLFLETARALRLVAPDHSVEFVALGAEFARVRGGHLGARRLTEDLAGLEARPTLYVLEGVGDGDLLARGPAAPEVYRAAEAVGLRLPAGTALKTLPGDEVLLDSGLSFAVVSGSLGDLASVLVELLQGG